MGQKFGKSEVLSSLSLFLLTNQEMIPPECLLWTSRVQNIIYYFFSVVKEHFAFMGVVWTGLWRMSKTNKNRMGLLRRSDPGRSHTKSGEHTQRPSESAMQSLQWLAPLIYAMVLLLKKKQPLNRKKKSILLCIYHSHVFLRAMRSKGLET